MTKHDSKNESGSESSEKKAEKKNEKLIKPHDEFPMRSQYADISIRERIEKQISEREPIVFMPVSITESLPYENYQLYLHGCLLSGDKATVIINKIPVFFDIRVPDNLTPNKFQSEMNSIFIKNKVPLAAHKKPDIFTAKAFIGYNRIGKYIRFYFDSLNNRKGAIQYCEQHKHKVGTKLITYETAFDDISSYFRKACRDNKFTMSDWNIITSYSVVRSKKVSKADYTIVCNYNDIEALQIDKTLDENQNYAEDKTIIMGWDIETHTYSPSNELPLPERETDEIFMIGVTFTWRHAKTPFLKIGMVTRDCNPDKCNVDILVRADDERDLIRSFAKLIGTMMPDFVVDFNGGQYDWPWLIDRANQYNILLNMIKDGSLLKRDATLKRENIKWYVKKNEIKIEAEKKHPVTYLRLAGFECIDTRPQFMKLYKTAEESSLKFYLSKCGLDSKLDMPYTRLQEIFRISDNLSNEDVLKWARKLKIIDKNEADVLINNSKKLQKFIIKFRSDAANAMAEAMDYCVIDAQRCQELLLAKSIINDVREVCNRSFTSMYDGIYLADGMKVKNLLMHWAMKRELEATTIAHPSERFKYPGAFVVPPEVGLENKRPVTGLDFSSLYPSLIRTYNLSAEYVVFTKEEADLLKAEGHNLHYIEFDGPNGKITGWTVRHDNLPEKTGIYPFILGMLFDQRSALKKNELTPLTETMEEVNKKISDNKTYKGLDADAQKEYRIKNPTFVELPSAEIDKLQNKYSATRVKYDYVNSKQKALKVFMNTFYGLMGDNTNSLFILLLAGAVTSAGQYNIKKVHEYVLSRGYKVKYGDTDSLYIIPPDSVYAEADKLYKKGKISKLEYWTQMVDLTMKDLAKFKDEVNNMLKMDNGTPFLKMAYEEVLFPVVFLAKKIYFGIPHENIVNFLPKELFMKGISVVKRGVPNIIKKLNKEIMWDVLGVDNTLRLKELAEEKIKTVLNRKWNLDDFSESVEYKPNKDQKTVHAFVNRLPKKDRPKPGVRFRYAVAEKYPFKYSIDGKKTELKKGDRIEFIETFERDNLKVDMKHYLERIGKQFAGFLVAEPEFAADTIKKAKTKAESYMKKMVAQIMPNVANKGGLYREVYAQSRNYIDEKYFEMYGESAEVLKIMRDDAKSDIIKKINLQVAATCRRKAYKQQTHDIVMSLIRSRKGKDAAFELWNLYYSDHSSIYRQRKRFIMVELAIAEKKLDKLLPKLKDLTDESIKITKDLVSKLHDELELDKIGLSATDNIPKLNDLIDTDKLKDKIKKKIKHIETSSKGKELLDELNSYVNRIYSLKMLEKMTDDVIKNLGLAKSAKVGNIEAPSNTQVDKKELAEMVKGLNLNPL